MSSSFGHPLFLGAWVSTCRRHWDSLLLPLREQSGAGRMHVHLPKPLHGWREFFHEVAIIVLGVLIALGFEQVVSASHDHASARETRASIRNELAENLRLILIRVRTEQCVQRRMREIAAFLDATSAGENPARPTWIGAPFAPLAGDNAFKSAQNAGKFFLLPDDEQQRIDVFYTAGADFNEQSTREWYDWAQLRSLTSSGTRLTDSEITRLRQALQDARGADWLIREDLNQYVRMARQQGIVARQNGIVASPQYRTTRDEQFSPACLPMTTPYAEAVANSSRPGLGYPE